MKKIIKVKILIWPVMGLFLIFSACNKKNETQNLATNFDAEVSVKNTSVKEPSQAFKDYWYAGKAEITSYQLEQARYGEIREGKAVLIYVTEDFLPNKQVKADNQNPNNISVLKLNATKKFNTGLYPYSIMQSTFYPVANNQHAIKLTSSIQEWCGQVYAQLNNKNKFEISAYSYFESEGDKNFKLEKSILENELWTQLRIDPKSLPVGSLKIIPSLEYSRLKHIEIKAYNAQVRLTGSTYSIEYPELNRTLAINFNPNFPHDILSWEETFISGFGNNAKTLTTKATKLNTIKSAYWNKNNNTDEVLRDTLQLN
ncbi:septum formation inhibitor Maf [Hwangdonia lutea]|uniref:Septum formation inhibitor Maf n=1 Tax=Hwangdonia lutea TaxID=3075823 RepID=A0AA97HRD3_9FLAO|nr:septum formation inhibitor Maf [Hwangdonia sp. SCSIO 19198]WOD43723.1 septum formation inhibitor Maf [Hwangdonia sp. SCSIO 19198]